MSKKILEQRMEKLELGHHIVKLLVQHKYLDTSQCKAAWFQSLLNPKHD